ncbi:MAG: tetratricopeptide repeat protein, partial [Alphaproteobacteria bacterium]
MIRLAAAAAILLLAGGCQEENRPAMSLEQARSVQAGFQGQAAFVPPPRTISDIEALLAQASPDPARVAALRAASEAEPPAGAAPAALYEFLLKRGQARSELGLRDAQLADTREAVRVGEAAGLDASRAHQDLFVAEAFAGNNRSALEAARKRVEAARAVRRPGSVSAGEAVVARLEAQLGDLAGAERTIAASRRSLLDPGYMRWPGFPTARRLQEGLVQTAATEVHMASGRYAEAEKEARQAVGHEEWTLANRRSVQGWVPDLSDETFDNRLIVSHVSLGDVLQRQGRLVEAEIEYRKGLVHALRVFGRDSLRCAALALSLGRNMIEQRRFLEAKRLAEIALEIYGRYGISRNSRFVANANTQLAFAAREAGDPVVALAALERAAAVFADDPDERFRNVDGLPVTLAMRIRAGRAADVNAHAERLATERARHFGDRHYETAVARGILGAAEAATGQRDRALESFRAAIPLLLQVSRQSEEEDGGARREFVLRFVLESYVAFLATLPAGASPGLDPAAESFRIADAARAQGVQRALAESAARSGIRDPGLASLVRQEQDARRQVAAQFGLLSNILSSPASQQDPAATASLRASIDTLRRARASLREEIERRFPDYASLVDPRP